MKTYLALLRGINVSGHKIIKMEDLRNLMESAGFKNVTTYIQSGNVIFDCAAASKESIAQKIKELIAKKYEFDVGVIILTYSELEVAIKNNPFTAQQTDLKQLYVAFFSEKPLAENIAKLEPEKIQPDVAVIDDRLMYIKFFVSAGTSKFSNSLIPTQGRLN